MRYGVKVLFTYSVGDSENIFYEESIFMVEAKSFDDAFEKTEKYVNRSDYNHLNSNNELVRREKVDILDCFIAFDEECDVQEIYSAVTKNKTSLSEREFYDAVTYQCDADEMYDLRDKDFN